MAIFSSDAQNKSDGKAENKQKGQFYLGQWCANSASFFENNWKHRDGGGVDKLIQNAILGKNADRAIFGHVFMKMKQETIVKKRLIFVY